MPTRSRKRSPPATRRRALELLEASIDGCTEAEESRTIMLRIALDYYRLAKLAEVQLANQKAIGRKT
jgi:hypothetical protein